MKVYETEQLRNIALVGHQGAGKTSLVESLLFNTGAITRMGKVEEGNTVTDFDEDEKDRNLSIFSAVAAIEHDGHKINVVDAPGYVDFQGEAKNAVRVADAVIVVVDAVSGPEVGTELAFTYASEFDLPVLVVVNKMDRENANFTNTLNAMRERFPDNRFVPLNLPIGSQADFKGVVDVLERKAYLGAGKETGDVPGDMADDVEEARLEMMEAAAESDDALLEKYFETEELSDDEITQGVLNAARSTEASLVPVFVTSATHSVGVLPLLSALVTYVAPPNDRKVALMPVDGGEEEVLEGPLTDSGPVIAYVFHSHTDKYGTLTYFRLFSGTMKSGDSLYNMQAEQEERIGGVVVMRGENQDPVDMLHAGDIGVVPKLQETHVGHTLAAKGFGKVVVEPFFPLPIYAVALHPKTQSDSAKMGEVLSGMTNSDPTLQWRTDPAIKQTILEGMGGTHIDVAIKRSARLGVELDTTVPKVPYQETVTKQASAVYRHKKQTGGAGQFGEVHLRVEPISQDVPEGEEVPVFEFDNEVFGGAVSQQFIGSTEKGVRQVLDQGVIAGYPVKFVRAVIFDGKMHPVDSKDIAFQIAGRGAFREAFADAGPVLMEPIMTVKVTVPEESMGDIMGDMNTRRGRVLGMETEAGRSVVTAEVPLAEIQRYSNDLRSMTAGRGVYTMEFLRYERVPANIQQDIIAKAEKEKEEEE
ncbi:MAG: elongation factor G [Chloroflexi bacterium]|nr:elongation factor G [Chloroflexota bacterium]